MVAKKDRTESVSTDVGAVRENTPFSADELWVWLTEDADRAILENQIMKSEKFRLSQGSFAKILVLKNF